MASVYPLAFPYSSVNPTITRLSRLSITNDNDTERFHLSIASSRCTSITKISTQTGEELPGPLRYVSNNSDEFPLLLCVPSSFHKCKLHLSFGGNVSHNENSLIILKTLGDDIDQEKLKYYLRCDDLDSKSREVSKISFSKLQSDTSSSQDFDVIVNDIYHSTKFSDGRINYLIWEYNSTLKEHILLLNFSFWVYSPDEAESPQSPVQPAREKALPVPPKSPPSAFTLSDFKRAFVFNTEDGPEFRGILSQYEKNLPKLRKAIHGLQEDVNHMETTFRRLLNYKRSILENLNVLVQSQFNPLLRRLDLPRLFQKNFLTFFEVIEKRMSFLFREVLNATILAKMSSYLSDVSSHDGADSSPAKKVFERNSKEYYEWLNKYLSNEKDRPESKLLSKRKIFELSKFDYLNSMNLASNNQYFNQFLENLFKFSSENFKLHRLDMKDFKINQALLSNDASVYLNTMSRFNSEKMQYRHMIEACAKNEELSDVIKVNPLSPSKEALEDESSITRKMSSSKVDLVFSSSTAYQSTPPITFQGTYPQKASNDQNAEISGILYALGGKGKPGWHKEWVALRDGRLTEYSDWRKGKSLINKPIDIALASVKAISYDRRQYCFEIMTSKGQKHVFQAINEDDRENWIRALYNAGQITQQLMASERKRKSNKPHLHLEKPLNVKEDPLEASRGSPVSIISSHIGREDSVEADYLTAVHSIPDSDNDRCADCGSYKSVEWISLTFLVTLCVRCSSSHRGLGSHVSKVRSLKLDNFDNENRILLKYINNAKANEYLQGRSQTISPDVDDEGRSAHIKRKYFDRAFVDKSKNFDELLVASVRIIDIPNVIKALNCGANPNLPLQMGSQAANVPPITISIFEYSLRKLVEVNEAGGVREYFVISELLLHHGCNIDRVKQLHSALNHTEEAKGYWNEKMLRLI